MTSAERLPRERDDLLGEAGEEILAPFPAAARPWPSPFEITAWILMAIAIVAVLKLGLLAALLSALLVRELVLTSAARMALSGLPHAKGRLIALGVLSLVTIAILSLAAIGVSTLLTGRSESLVALLRKMADVIETGSAHYPDWARAYLPASAADVEAGVVSWLRTHAGEVQAAGTSIGRTLVHIIIGMVIGGMTCLAPRRGHPHRPLGLAVGARMMLFASAFRRVVFAQVRISALNTVLTAIYLAIILPALGIQLPLVKTMIAVTFFAGLLPIIGNLISNTVIVVVSLSASIYAGLGSLLFLVLIHKLEYFVNARIIGTRIHARAWELLAVMLTMDAAFGIPGVIAGPIIYAYVKDELTAQGLI
jgi:predicted PurR-regulated permease PerM